MSIKIEFEPLRLQSLVKHLESTIKVATGQPIRLDIEQHIKALRKYIATRNASDIPSFYSLEALSGMIEKLNSLELSDGFFECLENRSSSFILQNTLQYYFDNHEDERVQSYIYANITKHKLSDAGWNIWSREADVFFKDDVINNLVMWIINKKIPLDKIKQQMGIREQKRIYTDTAKELTTKKHFNNYIQNLPLEIIISMLKDQNIDSSLNEQIWNISLPLFLDEAIKLKTNENNDHQLFSLAKFQLKPTKHPKWLRLSEDAKKAYQEWALGHLIEQFFEEDSDNKRVRFWKGYLSKIDDLKEIYHRGHVAAVCMTIGRHDFVEFKNIGAIYVYKTGTIWIPKSVRNLDRELKFRHKIINPGYGTENGEGWIPHYGNVWMKHAHKLIQKSLLS